MGQTNCRRGGGISTTKTYFVTFLGVSYRVLNSSQISEVSWESENELELRQMCFSLENSLHKMKGKFFWISGYGIMITRDFDGSSASLATRLDTWMKSFLNRNISV